MSLFLPSQLIPLSSTSYLHPYSAAHYCISHSDLKYNSYEDLPAWTLTTSSSMVSYNLMILGWSNCPRIPTSLIVSISAYLSYFYSADFLNIFIACTVNERRITNFSNV